MAKTTRTIEKDYGFKRIMKQYELLARKPYVKVGLLSGPSNKPKEVRTSDGGTKLKEELTILEVAVFNEFGTKNIPERSFIRSTYDEKKNEWWALTKNLKSKIYKGTSDVKTSLKIIGEKIVADDQKKIRSNVPPPNKPSTVRRKKSSKTLIDTGQLLGSIKYKVYKV